MAAILVTGGAGFIGSHLVRYLLKQGHRVDIVDSLKTGSRARIPSEAVLWEVDILSDEALNEVFQRVQPEVVVHLAAQTDVNASVRDPHVDAEVNITGTLHVLRCATLYRVRHFIFASSAAVYGALAEVPARETFPTVPLSPYGLSKLTGEAYVEWYARQHGFTETIFRLANVYGAGQQTSTEAGVISIFLERLLNEEAPVIYGDGSQTRDFIYVQDVARAIHTCITQPAHGVYHLSSGEETSIGELLELLMTLTGKRIEPIYEPARPGDILKSALSNEKARKIFQWAPSYSLEKGLHEMLKIRYNQKR